MHESIIDWFIRTAGALCSLIDNRTGNSADAASNYFVTPKGSIYQRSVTVWEIKVETAKQNF